MLCNPLPVLLSAACAACVVSLAVGHSGAQAPRSSAEVFKPYEGPINVPEPITTIKGTVLAGYQGWFMAEGDGFDMGFIHWGDVDHDPPRATVDMWPDMSELDEDEKFDTNFKYPDGTPAKVFSSTSRKTVMRHFEWMKDYGIDGVWVQRFTGEINPDEPESHHDLRTNTVLMHAREAANTHGRGFAVMYDCAFDRKEVDEMLKDWKRLVHDMKVLETPAYMRHEGKPVMSLWGFGFGHRAFDADAARELLEYITSEEGGNCAIMLGVPNDWRDWDDERLELLKEFGDIISPWNVGRFGTVEGAEEHYANFFPGDIKFTQAHDQDYYPVIFPGFSWTNLRDGRTPLNAIPRQGGKFAWEQARLAVEKYGLDMIYLAMFDEVDEGTAWFKVSNQPPVGMFATYEGYPSDHYLTIAGEIGKMVRGESYEFPDTKPNPDDMTYQPLSQLEFFKADSPFSEKTTKQWENMFGGKDIYLHEGPYSEWTVDLYNAGAIDFKSVGWDQILKEKSFGSELAVLAAGYEDLAYGRNDADAIAKLLRKHMQDGHTILVLGGGPYPAYHPGEGAVAQTFGFELEFTQILKDGLVRPVGPFAKHLDKWTPERTNKSRLMNEAVYPNAKSYHSLMKVFGPDGEYIGDAVAAVQPGGEFNDGTIVYLASGLTQYPDREGLLDQVLKATHSLMNK